jgi:uncharacterized delta-60 repeat protein
MKTTFSIATMLLIVYACLGQELIRDISFNSNRFTANANVRCVAIQTDQKIVFFGDCSFYDGVYTPYGGRLLKSGLRDNSFGPVTLDARVDDVKIQPWDQKIVIAGSFTNVNGTPRKGIARLNTDGSLDASFDPGSGIDGTYGGDLRIWCLAIKDDGIAANRRIIAGGQFQLYNGVFIGNQGGLIQLFENGSRDASYDPLVEQGPVYAMALDDNRKLVIGGEFWSVANTFKLRTARLNEDGTLDNSFNSGPGFSGPGGSVTSVTVMDDGKVMIGGYFQSFSGIACNHLARLNTDGTRDGSFNIGTGFQFGSSIFDVTTEVRRILPVAGGSMIVGGNFTTYNGTACGNVIKLRSDGSIATDTSFGTGFNEWVMDFEIQEYLPGDHRIIVSGFFDRYDGYQQGAIMRLVDMVVLETVPKTQQVNNTAVFNSIVIYPNPFKEIVFAASAFSEKRMCTFSLYDMNGHLLKTWKNLIQKGKATSPIHIDYTGSRFILVITDDKNGRVLLTSTIMRQ